MTAPDAKRTGLRAAFWGLLATGCSERVKVSVHFVDAGEISSQFVTGTGCQQCQVSTSILNNIGSPYTAV